MQKYKIIREGKSEQEIMNKSYLHKLLYFGVDGSAEFGEVEKNEESVTVVSSSKS
jgi:hypothetical protein